MNKIAVVGSGPSGLFLSKNLLKKYKNNVTIDIYEKSNAPLGLLRYGVAPDHQEVKVNHSFIHFKSLLRKNLCIILNKYLNPQILNFLLT
jgi:NADPH-dependent glutamate synthase beta subunit-like oxidoreductase